VVAEPSISTVPQPSRYPQTSIGQSIREIQGGVASGDLLPRGVKKEAYSQGVAGDSSTAELTISSPTLPSARPAEPSVDEIMRNPLIDPRSIGVETWPINGLRTWEGLVIEISGRTFSADITPLSEKGGGTPLRTDFSIDALDGEDKNVAAGDLFYLIARRVRVHHRLTTSYSLQLRRTGRWTATDLAEIEANKNAILNMLRENAE
jgi:hypothetical protein